MQGRPNMFVPIRRLRQVIAVLLFERAASFAVLPEETASAAIGTVSIVTHAVDHDRFIFH